MQWHEVWMKAARYLGYKRGFETGAAKGLEQGKIQGRLEAQVFVQLMQHYGSIDAIPTAVLRKELPGSHHIFIAQQLIKLATIRLQAIIEAIGMPRIDNTVDIVIKFLERDPAMTEEEAAAIDAILDSQSCFGGLISLAERVDHLDVELFMKLIREPLPKPHLNEYYDCLKNDHFIVR